MLLIDVISQLDENKNCYVFNYDRLVTFYDGKNSIDESCNSRAVKNVKFANNAYYINLK